jgi:hypothetical protein
MNAVVKKWSDLSADDKKNFHQITMVDNDGMPSNANIGKANAGNSNGWWRRNVHAHTYCHETLHLLGLPDQYCSRIYNVVDSSASVEISCDPPPDPNLGTCCTPTAQRTRCSTPTARAMRDDLMATLTPDVSLPEYKRCFEGCGYE